MLRNRLSLLAALLVLTGCDRIDALVHPYDETAPTHVIPAPPNAKGPVMPYPGAGDTVSLQSRPGDCSKVACFELVRGKWLPLPAADATSVSLLNVDGATGSDYQEYLWRSIGTGGRQVLVNTAAGDSNLADGLFDGPRIGLRDGAHTTYVTVYAVEKSPGAGDPIISPPRLSLVARSDTLWLLQTRPDGAGNIVDLFAVSAGAQIICMPGLILDTAGRWAGPPERALSPDLFISRVIDRQANRARRDALLTICNPPAPKARSEK